MGFERTVDAAIRTLRGMAPEFTAEEARRSFQGPLSEARRDPGLPALCDLPDWLFEAPRDVAVRRKAVHEAGHAAVALLLGDDAWASIDMGGTETFEGAVVWTAECHIEGAFTPEQRSRVVAAGLVTETLVWGADTYWAGALSDLIELARERHRASVGALPYALARAWTRSGIPVPAAFDTSLGPAHLVDARNAISRRAVEAAVQAFPGALAIARMVEINWDLGHRIVAEPHVRKAFDLGMSGEPLGIDASGEPTPAVGPMR